MQARGVAIHQPELLAMVFHSLSTESGPCYTSPRSKTQAALSQASKEWLAVSRACGPVQVSLKPGSLESAPRWLALRPTVTRLAFEYLHIHSRHYDAKAGDLDEQTAAERFRAAVQAAAGRLQELEVSCDFDVSLHLLPPLPSLKWLSLRWYFGWDGSSGVAPPLDCLAWLAPQLESLCLFGGWGTYHVQGTTVPAGLRKLILAGNINGLEPALGQLQSLIWGPMERQGGFELTARAMHALSKAAGLTSLDLSSPCWVDATGFFNCLASLTSLHHLCIGHTVSDVPTYLSPEAYGGEGGTHQFVIHDMLGPALEHLTRLTSLDLSGHDLPELPDTIAILPALSSLDVGMNELRDLPRGPWPSLEALSCNSELVDAALAALAQHGKDPSRPAQHTLCSLTQLTKLWAYSFGLSDQETQERKQKVLAVLPQLQSLSL